MANQAGATSSSTHEKSKSPPIKTRTERHENLVRMLRESLSRKISEKLMAQEREQLVKGVGEEVGSESPTSTLSSSGEREGGYNMLYGDSLDSGDESGELHMTVM